MRKDPQNYKGSFRYNAVIYLFTVNMAPMK
jgi:hypothetical protein